MNKIPELPAPVGPLVGVFGGLELLTYAATRLHWNPETSPHRPVGGQAR